MSDNKKLNDSELDNVAGGMGNVDMHGSITNGDTTIVDQSISTTVEKTTTITSTINDTCSGDIITGNDNANAENGSLAHSGW